MQTELIVGGVACALVLTLVLWMWYRWPPADQAADILEKLRGEYFTLSYTKDGHLPQLSSPSMVIQMHGSAWKGDEEILVWLIPIQEDQSPGDFPFSAVFEFKNFEPVRGGASAKALRDEIRRILVNLGDLISINLVRGNGET